MSVSILHNRRDLREFIPSKKLLFTVVIQYRNWLITVKSSWLEFNFSPMLNLDKVPKGNTVGRLSQREKLAYIAGFLDGDGSIMLQLRKNTEGKIIRIKTVICIYQDNSHKKDIEWMQKILGGYVYTRNDNICELRIEGFTKTLKILMLLKPFLRIKKKQASLLIKLIPKLQQKTVDKYSVSEWIKKMREYNYYSSQRTAL